MLLLLTAVDPERLKEPEDYLDLAEEIRKEVDQMDQEDLDSLMTGEKGAIAGWFQTTCKHVHWIRKRDYLHMVYLMGWLVEFQMPPPKTEEEQ